MLDGTVKPAQWVILGTALREHGLNWMGLNLKDPPYMLHPGFIRAIDQMPSANDAK